MDQERVIVKGAKARSNSAGLVRRLGRTGFQVNVLGLGGHAYPVGYGPDCFMTPDARSQLIGHLVSAGVNYFDTTYLYEAELLADSFKRLDIRENVVVSLYGGYITEAQWHQKLRSEIESRLDILGYTRAPLFIASAGDGEASYADILAACEAMAELKKEKIIQNIGLSCHAIDLFPVISKVIRDTDLLDYIMIRFNWKFQQANEELFPVAEEHDVGIVVMKIFCWDCGPSQWGRRISVFEPIDGENVIKDDSSLTSAQRNILWCIQNSPCDVLVPSMNTMREVQENIQALGSIDTYVATDDFEKCSSRLWNRKELRSLARYAESKTIRDMAENLLRPRPRRWHIVIRTIRAHYMILRDEGLKKYLLYSYNYRKGQLSNCIKKIWT